MICVGLFLFYVFNNLPGVLKNTLIIFGSDRFVSKDADDITKIHYWRDSDFTRETESSGLFITTFVFQYAMKQELSSAQTKEQEEDSDEELESSKSAEERESSEEDGAMDKLRRLQFFVG